MNLKFCFICLFLFVHNPLAAADRFFMATLDNSSWVMTESTVLVCKLEHKIPQFGKAVFYQQAGRKMGLSLITQRQYPKDLAVDFRAVTASWKPQQSESMLASMKTTGFHDILKINQQQANDAFFGLYQGSLPSFFFYDDKDSNYDHKNSELPIRVSLSMVRFRQALSEFETCVSKLHPDNFWDVRMTKVHFDHDEEFPKEQEEELVFKRMLAYLKVDPSIKSIRILGHADKTGSDCYNDNLSERRASYVYDLLIQNNVDFRKLSLQYYGEHQPLSKGDSLSALADNRRVSVILER